MKSFLKIIAVAAAACATLGMSACGGTANYKIGTSPNWDARVVIKNDLTENSEWLTNKEVAVYSVAFTKGANESYSVEYVTDGSKTASYVTQFYAVRYDWSSADLPEEYRVENTTEYVYVYKTQVILSGRVTFGEEYKEFDNVISTVSYFRSAEDNLQPVYSKQVIKCTSPANLFPSSLETAYVVMDRVYETFYNFNCTEARVTCTDNSDSEMNGTDKISVSSSYSLFDVNSLGAAMRSLTFSGTHVFDTLIPIEGKKFTYQVSCASAATLDAAEQDNQQIISALNAAVDSRYLFSGVDEEGNREYKYNALTLSYVSSMPGSSSVYWYANVADARMNSTRAALLKVIDPVPFSLGTLTYSLSSLSQESL